MQEPNFKIVAPSYAANFEARGRQPFLRLGNRWKEAECRGQAKLDRLLLEKTSPKFRKMEPIWGLEILGITGPKMADAMEEHERERKRNRRGH
jgi:hypothetical protein